MQANDECIINIWKKVKFDRKKTKDIPWIMFAKPFHYGSLNSNGESIGHTTMKKGDRSDQLYLTRQRLDKVLGQQGRVPADSIDDHVSLHALNYIPEAQSKSNLALFVKNKWYDTCGEGSVTHLQRQTIWNSTDCVKRIFPNSFLQWIGRKSHWPQKTKFPNCTCRLSGCMQLLRCYRGAPEQRREQCPLDRSGWPRPFHRCRLQNGRSRRGYRWGRTVQRNKCAPELGRVRNRCFLFLLY